MALARVPDRLHPGRADGEALHPGWIAQPACTASSSALALGALVLARSLRRTGGTGGTDGTDRTGGTGSTDSTERVDTAGGWVLVAALGANALGSAGFHGPGDAMSRRVHDISLAAMVTVCAGGALRGVLRGPRAAARSLALPAVLLAAGAIVGRLSRSGGPWWRPHAVLQGHAAWHVLAAAGVTLAGRRMFAEHLTD